MQMSISSDLFPLSISYKRKHTQSPSLQSLYLPPVHAEVQDRGVREDVVVHEERRPLCVRQEHQRGHDARAQVQGQVRLPAGVLHERVHRAAQALRHHEGGREPGLQGLRGGHAQGIPSQVLIHWLIVMNPYDLGLCSDWSTCCPV